MRYIRLDGFLIARRFFQNQNYPVQITEITRRKIGDAIRQNAVVWAGRFAEDEFLARLFDIDAMCSKDARFPTARREIQKHRVENPDDWDDDWIFYDDRFGLLTCSDKVFLRFVLETLHPVVRRNESEAAGMAGIYNEKLKHDGVVIVEVGRVSGEPLFGAQALQSQDQRETQSF